MVRLLKHNGGDTDSVWVLVCAFWLAACAPHRPDLATAPPPPVHDVARRDGLSAIAPVSSPRNAPPQQLMSPDNNTPLVPVLYLGAPGGGASGSMFSHPDNLALNLPPRFSLGQKHHDGDCRFVDRFDRRAALAYNFDTNHQLALKMGINNNGGLNVSHARLAFNYRFNDVRAPMPPEKKEKCRYSSAWQGEVGSVTNELLFRDRDSLWSDFTDRGLDFWH